MGCMHNHDCVYVQETANSTWQLTIRLQKVFQNLATEETDFILTNLSDRLIQASSGHAEYESEFRNLEIPHPDLEVEEIRPPKRI